MKPTGPRLDKNGFPIPPDFDEAGIDSPSSGRSLFSLVLRPLLKVALLAVIASALWIHFDAGSFFRNALADYHAQQARELAVRGDYAGALNEIDQALGWVPDSVGLLFLRGQIHFIRGDYAAALPDITRAIEIKPNHEASQMIRLGLLHRLGRYREAAAAAGDILQRQLGSRASTLNSRAYARALGDFELNEALADIDEALTTDEEEAAYLDTRGYVLFKLGRHREALDYIERAITTLETQRDELEQAGRVRRPTNEREAAQRVAQLQSFDEALGEMYHHRGEVHEKLGNAEQAKKDFFIGQQLGYKPVPPADVAN